jgi:hypothetical protein
MAASTIRRLITYARTHGFTSECRILQVPFPNANTDRRNAECDSCGGRIGGPRLYCLDCATKSTELYDSLDLCCAPKCVGARITHRQDLESAHEPSHRLVKFRTTVLTRSSGRVWTAACGAFERVGGTCGKIAELGSHIDEETGPDEQKTSSFGPASTEMPTEGDELDSVPSPPDDTKGGAELEDKNKRDARQDQVKEESLPTCGKCKGRLSFPFWYCIFCEGWSQG